MSSIWESELGFPGEEQPLLQNIPDFLPDLGPNLNFNDAPPTANVEFLNLSENQVFEKVQSRRGGRAKQVVDNGLIKMKATYGPDDLFQVHGWVRREETAAQLCGDNNDAVPLRDEVTGQMLNLVNSTDLEIVSHEPRVTSQMFSIDLGKVYEGPNQPVFKLAKTDTDARNRFQLLIQLQFALGQKSRIFCSPTFRCKTKPKRPKLEAREEEFSGPSPAKISNTEPPSVSSVDSGTADLSLAFSPLSPPNSNNGDAILNKLEAKTALIDDLVVRKNFQTPHADIAYHLRIEDGEIASELEEGDIVGFFTDKNDGGTFIKRFVNDDVEEAVHAGVVSRSYYLAANKPIDDSEKSATTDTVCVIGIVNVKVIGSVENGERVYASVTYPGKAVPQSHLPVGCFLRKKHVLLGMSLEKKSAKSLEEPHLVKCFVCIVLDANRQEVLEEIEKLYESTEETTHQKIREAQKRTWKRLKWCFAFSMIFLILLSILLYQVLAPGSKFRYWLCRQGSISGRDVHFRYIPLRDKTREYNVHGINFDFEKLLEKISDKDIQENNVTTGGKAYYYLNLDRCAFNGDYGELGNFVSGRKSVGGGLILSVNKTCSTVYWYGVEKISRVYNWQPYISAKDLKCTPQPPY